MTLRGKDRTLFPAAWNVQPPAAPRPRVGVGQLITQSIDVIRDRFADVGRVVLLTAGAAVGLQILLKAFFPSRVDISNFAWTDVIGGGVLLMLVGILFVWLQTSLTFLTGADRLGVEMSGKEALRQGFEAVPAGIWTRFVQLIILIPAYLMLIVPGALLTVRWCVGMQISAFEKRSGFDALGASAELVRGQAWDVFERLFLFWLVQVAFAIAFGIAGAIFAGVTLFALPLNPVTTALAQFASLVGSACALAFYSIWRTHFYLALVDEQRALEPVSADPEGEPG
jgi:hypothetical protein